MVQLSHQYMTAGKTISLVIRNFVGKVMSLLFNPLSRLVIAFLPRSKRHLISWLQSLYKIHSDFGAQENKISHCSLFYLPWSDGTRCHDLSFLNKKLNLASLNWRESLVVIVLEDSCPGYIQSIEFASVISHSLLKSLSFASWPNHFSETAYFQFTKN